MRRDHPKVSRSSVTAAAAMVIAVVLVAPHASAAHITVHGGPSYTSPTSGFAVVNDAGTAAATVWDSGPVPGTSFTPSRAFRWDASGAPPVELGNLGAYGGGISYSVQARAINNAGTIVGSASNSVGTPRPVRWDASGTAATPLQGLDVHFDGWPGGALAINDAGTAVGFAQDWDPSYRDVKPYATRWDASGTAITALGYPGNNGAVSTIAIAINKSGTVIDQVGYRWDASGALSHSLEDGKPEAINDAGTVVGVVYTPQFTRAARWGSSSTTGTALDGLGLGSSAWDINNAGTAIGIAALPGGGTRAVRWDAGGVAVTELGTVGTLAYPFYVAAHINDAGAIVGTASASDSSRYPATSDARAIYWGPDGVALDLNTLIDPQSGWTLNVAQGLSNTGWIVGTGTFDPDGPGGQAAYDRLFLLQLAVAVPEPGALASLTVAVSALSRRRRQACD